MGDIVGGDVGDTVDGGVGVGGSGRGPSNEMSSTRTEKGKVSAVTKTEMRAEVVPTGATWMPVATCL